MFDFGPIAQGYDSFYNTPLGRDIDIVEKRAVGKMIESLPRNISLEIGCGTGHWTEFFTGLGFPLVAIDISEEMLAVARTKNIAEAVFLQMDVEHMDFRDEYFYNVFAITVLEFVDNLDKALSEIYRVLRPGGHLLIGALNANSPYIQQKKQNPKSSIAHARAFTPETLRSVLSVFGDPIIQGVLVMEGDKVIDKDREVDQEMALRQGAFLVGLVRKTR